MLKRFLKNCFFALPAAPRYHLFKNLRPKLFRRYQELRKIETTSGASLKAFDEHRCIFVHIPKCAGVSISNTLFNSLGGGHRTAEEYQLIYNPRDFASYFKFAIVRNPWDRLVSAFHFLKAGGMNEVNKAWGEKHLSPYEDFNDFVRDWVNPSNIRTEVHFRPQVEFVYRGSVLLVDFLAYYENLEQDFAYICNQLGMHGKVLAKKNISKKRSRDYKEYYTEDTWKKVAEIYREDIALLGYDFANSSLPFTRSRPHGRQSRQLKPVASLHS